MTRPGVLSASVAQGYPYADVEEMGMAFLAVTDNDPALARATARQMASLAWQHRAELDASTPTPEQALRAALAEPEGPIVLMDVGDNIGGGTTGDSTAILAEALKLGVPHYLQTLYDPEAVQACVAAGVGATISLAIGGKTADSPAPPVLITGKVRTLGDGNFEERRPIHGGGRYFSAGLTAVLETDLDQTVVLTSNVIGNTSIEQMYSLGVFPERKRVVVAKGVVSPRPAYGPIARKVVLVNSPGITTSNLNQFTYHHRRRPLYPFERDAQWANA
jgi:microcystin degradation protein MlrC